MTNPIDPVELAAAMMRRPSVTPLDAGALDVLQEALEGLGFTCHRLPFAEEGTDEVDNLYARRGTSGRNFCFAGHTDVVPPGEVAEWSVDPFEAAIRDGVLIGRGACDMKGAIACFVAATERFVASHEGESSISLLITGDEEGPAVNGTRKVLGWLVEQGETLDACLVGEPTNPTALGEMIKVGRRGSLNARIIVHGVQGHAAYPHLADNPIDRLVAILHRLTTTPLDGGSDHFQPSTLAATTVDVDNPTTNVIPAKASAGVNIRFNDHHTGASLSEHLQGVCDAAGGEVELVIAISGESFLREPDEFAVVIADAAEQVLGKRPEYSTTGGTSDARFIKDHCPVAEFGLIGQTMHKVDERIGVDELHRLTDVYQAVLERYFAV
ncbi:MAG: succinyl-diaminopimelate desuccinylase [Rhodospirillaceae bacterium]|jgi:succinyl-diaminopimelate desuccinylase|nr:succinyl-diaminopimelate desuccinylase [Rhodospirillaceae bacterium]MBT6202687.1 succinyl-diaminopimelate desuccinylase [Rhodospirillaceae bacterium]MBT6511735.1 succinyl-diaminopimelate desuccinylase [Rhodospirillaceae bacterium]MBT7648996.1 succinyl-diaminopimelate desuccinylase [Rhodospirillaceae bacterium]